MYGESIFCPLTRSDCRYEALVTKVSRFLINHRIKDQFVVLSASRDHSEQATIDERRRAREIRNNDSVDRLLFVETDPPRTE